MWRRGASASRSGLGARIQFGGARFGGGQGGSALEEVPQELSTAAAIYTAQLAAIAAGSSGPQAGGGRGDEDPTVALLVQLVAYVKAHPSLATLADEATGRTILHVLARSPEVCSAHPPYHPSVARLCHVPGATPGQRGMFLWP
jgi:hypothetical protein|eukprot:COSAG01_NODE_19076_length_1032_cov_1.241158_1_plen_144_part_00